MSLSKSTGLGLYYKTILIIGNIIRKCSFDIYQVDVSLRINIDHPGKTMHIKEKSVKAYKSTIIKLQCNQKIFDAANLLITLLQHYQKKKEDSNLNKPFVAFILNRYQKLKNGKQQDNNNAIPNQLHPFILNIITLLRKNFYEIKGHELASLFSAFFSFYKIYQILLPDIIRSKWQLEDVYDAYLYQEIGHHPNGTNEIEKINDVTLLNKLSYVSHCQLLRNLPKKIDEWVVDAINSTHETKGKAPELIDQEKRSIIRSKSILFGIVKIELSTDNTSDPLDFLNKPTIYSILINLAPLISNKIYPQLRTFFLKQLAKNKFEAADCLAHFEGVLSQEDKLEIMLSMQKLIKSNGNARINKKACKFALSYLHWLNNKQQYNMFNSIQAKLTPDLFIYLIKLRQVIHSRWMSFLENQIREFITHIKNTPVNNFHTQYGKLDSIWNLLTKDEQDELIDAFTGYIDMFQYYLINLYPLLDIEQQNKCSNTLKNLPKETGVELREVIDHYDNLYQTLNGAETKEFEKGLLGLASELLNTKKPSSKKSSRSIKLLKGLFEKCPCSIKCKVMDFIFNEIIKAEGRVNINNIELFINEFTYEQNVGLLTHIMSFYAQNPKHLHAFASILNQMNEDCVYHLIPQLDGPGIKHFCYKSLFFRAPIPAEAAAIVQQFHHAHHRWHKSSN